MNSGAAALMLPTMSSCHPLQAWAMTDAETNTRLQGHQAAGWLGAQIWASLDPCPIVQTEHKD